MKCLFVNLTIFIVFSKIFLKLSYFIDNFINIFENIPQLSHFIDNLINILVEIFIVHKFSDFNKSIVI